MTERKRSVRKPLKPADPLPPADFYGQPIGNEEFPIDFNDVLDGIPTVSTEIQEQAIRITDLFLKEVKLDGETREDSLLDALNETPVNNVPGVYYMYGLEAPLACVEYLLVNSLTLKVSCYTDHLNDIGKKLQSFLKHIENARDIAEKVLGEHSDLFEEYEVKRSEKLQQCLTLLDNLDASSPKFSTLIEHLENNTPKKNGRLCWEAFHHMAHQVLIGVSGAIQEQELDRDAKKVTDFIISHADLFSEANQKTLKDRSSLRTQATKWIKDQEGIDDQRRVQGTPPWKNLKDEFGRLARRTGWTMGKNK